MQGEKGMASLLDFISYYESGPVLKQRPPDVIRTPSHPEELSFNYADDDPATGKSLTRRRKNKEMHKKALGLTDVPGGSPPGAQGYRPRSSYEQQDFEASHTTGFGGPSVIDADEDKPPSNISRLDKTKPINISTKIESENFFSFLETGKLSRKRMPKEGTIMNTEKRELVKLAKVLNLSGHKDQSNRVIKLAYDIGPVGGGDYYLDDDDVEPYVAPPTFEEDAKAAFEAQWAKHRPNRFVRSHSPGSSAAVLFAQSAQGAMTNEGKMAAALWHGFTEGQLTTAMEAGRSVLRWDYNQAETDTRDIILSENNPGANRDFLLMIHNGEARAQGFDPEEGTFKGRRSDRETETETDDETDRETDPETGTPAVDTRFSTATGTPFPNWEKEDGDLFRAWVRGVHNEAERNALFESSENRTLIIQLERDNTPDNDLDESGGHKNTYMKIAWKEWGDEYDALKGNLPDLDVSEERSAQPLIPESGPEALGGTTIPEDGDTEAVSVESSEGEGAVDISEEPGSLAAADAFLDPKDGDRLNGTIYVSKKNGEAYFFSTFKQDGSHWNDDNDKEGRLIPIDDRKFYATIIRENFPANIHGHRNAHDFLRVGPNSEQHRILEQVKAEFAGDSERISMFEKIMTGQRLSNFRGRRRERGSKDLAEARRYFANSGVSEDGASDQLSSRQASRRFARRERERLRKRSV